ncbi:pPIWI_RE_Y domain-containing protein [Streptomyces buecherae]|uniref:pPIWI_RE_Y domain-containing protein n=1 Tax=Streptomyces buecherae TaxID=2763006 RepID=UPI00364C23B2
MVLVGAHLRGSRVKADDRTPRADRVPSPVPSPEAPGQLPLFLEVAQAVAELSEHKSLRSFSLPYPPRAQRALDRMVLHCLALGQAPPRGVPELLAWCARRTVSDPVFGVPDTLVAPDARLVDPVGRMPTRTCLELASHGPDGVVEQRARNLLGVLEARCGSAERFLRCRSFLARHPVVHQHHRFQREWDKTGWTRVKNLYRPVPESMLSAGLLLRCSNCGLPALLRDGMEPWAGPLFSGSETWCESEECPHGTPLTLTRDPSHALVLDRSLRSLLALPYAVEQAALDELDHVAIAYEPLPGGISAYRLRDVASPARTLYFYDRLQPALLAARCAAPEALSAGPAFVVIPERLAHRADYRATFTAALPEELRERVTLTTPQGLLQALRSPLARSQATMPGHRPPSTADHDRRDDHA